MDDDTQILVSVYRRQLAEYRDIRSQAAAELGAAEEAHEAASTRLLDATRAHAKAAARVDMLESLMRREGLDVEEDA